MTRRASGEITPRFSRMRRVREPRSADLSKNLVLVGMKTLSRFFSVPAALAIIAMTAGCPGDVTESTGGVNHISIILSGDTTIFAPVTLLGVGATVTATAELLDNADRDVAVPVTWSSSNPSVASVPTSTGVSINVTGVSAGTVTITATAGGKAATRQLTIATIVVAAVDGIVVSSSRDGNSEIYLLEASGPRNLTHNAAEDITPTKSGNRIFFSSNRSGNYEIYSMKFDGTDVVRLTNNAVTDAWPTVSPTGLVAFSRDVGAGREQIFTMNSLGQNQTNISNNTFGETNPAFSPDGTRLTYASDRDAKYGPGQYLDIYSMKPDGTGVTRLTFNDNGIDYHAAWSPDGSKIAFSTNRSANPFNVSDPTCYDQALEIWVMNANGSGLRNLTNSCRGEAWPAWSPNGSEIVFMSDRGSATKYAWDLWKMPSDGGTATRLTATGKEATPAWR